MAAKGKKLYPQSAHDALKIINYFLDGYSVGLEILHGVAPFPDLDELNDFMAVFYGDDEVPQKVAEFLAIIERLGGFERFVEVFRRRADEGTVAYYLVVDWARGVKRGRPFKWTECSTAKLAKKYKAHPDTLRRRYNAFLMETADKIAKPRSGDGTG